MQTSSDFRSASSPALILATRKVSNEGKSPRLSMERKVSGPDSPRTLQRTFSTIFEKLSPANSPRNSRGEKGNSVVSPRHPAQTPVFFVRIPTQIRVANYLEVDEGDVITARSVETEQGLCIAENNRQAGVIRTKDLYADSHTSNVYLGALEVLLKHPPLLQHIIEIDALEFPKKLPQLVALFTARKILPLALKTLFAHELSSKKANPVLREQTAAVKLALAVIDSGDQKKMAAFQKEFVLQAVKSIESELKQEKSELSAIAVTIEKSFEHLLSQLEQNKIPHEFGLVLEALKETHNQSNQDVSLGSLQGSIVFLRYLCPALRQPKEKCGIKKIKNTKLVSELAKALLLLSNQTLIGEEEEAHPFYDIKTTLEKQRAPIASLLTKMASMPQPVIPEPGACIKEAASMYGLIVRCGRTFEDNKDLQDTLNSLEKHWGKAPQRSIEYDDEVPMLDEISQLSSKLQQASLG
jgi:hypothetical protein